MNYGVALYFVFSYACAVQIWGWGGVCEFVGLRGVCVCVCVCVMGEARGEVREERQREVVVVGVGHVLLLTSRKFSPMALER